jgi:dihydrodipicolinate synthase/N-acetylneuraminate lyase
LIIKIVNAVILLWFEKTPPRHLQLRRLVAAAFTPFRADSSLHFMRIKPVIDSVIAQGVTSHYVCGSAS